MRALWFMMCCFCTLVSDAVSSESSKKWALSASSKAVLKLARGPLWQIFHHFIPHAQSSNAFRGAQMPFLSRTFQDPLTVSQGPLSLHSKPQIWYFDGRTWEWLPTLLKLKGKTPAKLTSTSTWHQPLLYTSLLIGKHNLKYLLWKCCISNQTKLALTASKSQLKKVL